MDREEFENTWSPLFEGEKFSNKSRIDYLRAEAKKHSSLKWVGLTIPIVGGIAIFFGVAERTIIIAGGVIALYAILEMCSHILDYTADIRVELELLKGSIRTNRFSSAHQHEILMKAAGRDEYGHRLEE